MQKSFSNVEIEKYIPEVVLYEDLGKLTPEQLINKLPVAILYQETETYGHWTLLHKTPEGIEFFDPYGILIDKEFEQIEWKQPHYLAKLLYKLSKSIPINYNQYKFQKKKPGVNTCGRWIILRSLLGHMPLDVFADMITKAALKLDLSTDQLSVRAFQE